MLPIRSSILTAAAVLLLGSALLAAPDGAAPDVHVRARVVDQALEETPAYSRDLVARNTIANPADEARKKKGEETSTGRLRTWEMPPVTVEGRPLPRLKEEQRIGAYAQPRWTALRRFPATRIYVRPEGTFELEFWGIAKKPRHGGNTEYTTQAEAEIGLPSRFQLDLYSITRREGTDGQTFVDQSVELRYALADWGELPGNPTLYAEYTSVDAAPDLVETKLLLGGDISPGWHWGANLSLEMETSGKRSREFEFTGGVSRTLIDEKLSVGVEAQFGFEDLHRDRGRFTEDLQLGPSLQYRPFPRCHIDVAPLFGLTQASHTTEVFIVVGFEF